MVVLKRESLLVETYVRMENGSIIDGNNKKKQQQPFLTISHQDKTKNKNT